MSSGPVVSVEVSKKVALLLDVPYYICIPVLAVVPAVESLLIFLIFSFALYLP